MAAINERKAKKIYDVIDATDFYINNVDPECRSCMNIPFQLRDKVSIYNAVPEAAVDALIVFMRDFEKRHG